MEMGEVGSAIYSLYLTHMIVVSLPLQFYMLLWIMIICQHNIAVKLILGGKGARVTE